MNWQQLSQRVLRGGQITPREALAILESKDDALLAVLDAAFRLRLRYFKRGVRLHLIRNARQGNCSEDCAYCSQSAASHSHTPPYPWQSPADIIEGARQAQRLGAFRYCIVSSGRNPSARDISHICQIVHALKKEVPIQVCVSLGLLTLPQARQLKAAGVNRYNHNLETSARFFKQICSTHTYADRRATARTIKKAGLELCCGGLLGLGETLQDRVALALAVRELKADSIPINFFDPRPGTPLGARNRMQPADALRALAMFRFVNPQQEIRVAGGREACLGHLQALALFPANSMFTNGYLTTAGQGYEVDRAMIAAAGFKVEEITCA